MLALIHLAVEDADDGDDLFVEPIVNQMLFNDQSTPISQNVFNRSSQLRV